MIIRGKKILLISPQKWGNNFLSKHHYAQELANRGNDVFFLNPPSSKDSVERKNNHLFIVDYQPKIRGLAKMPNILSAWLIKKEIHRLEKFCNTKFDLIWNFDSSRFFNLKSLNSKLRISHIVDQNEGLNIRLLNSHVDLNLTVTDLILERQRKFNNNSFNIGHGVYVPDKPSEIVLPSSKSHIKVGYLGNLLIKHLDWELIHKIVIDNPFVTFYFAGPYSKSNLSSNALKPKFLQSTMHCKNTVFLGAIRPEKIQSFLSQVDMLLLVYKPENNKEQLANSHKLMEYLASGRVTVASWTDEYKNKRNLLEMVEKNSMFAERFNTVIKNLGYFNDTTKQNERKAWAMKHTYKHQVEKIENLLSKLYDKHICF